MSLIIPQSNKRFKKTSNQKLSMKKKGIVDIPYEYEPMETLMEHFRFNGKTPIYLIYDENSETFFADTKPFTLKQAKEETDYEEEEE